MAAPQNTLITRAEITSIASTTTRRKAIVLDGTTHELGDTGPRDLSGLFLPGTVESGELCVQRIGQMVHFTAINLRLQNVVSATHTILNNADGLLTPFAPVFGAQDAVLIDGSVKALCRLHVQSGGTVALQYSEANRPWTGSLTFMTGRAWGTGALPGVDRGQPVGL